MDYAAFSINEEKPFFAALASNDCLVRVPAGRGADHGEL